MSEDSFGRNARLNGRSTYELRTNHTRKQFETFTEQAKQLASLAQSATLAAAEPLKAGVAKALNHAV
jgi:hypothetical protein